MTEQLLVTGGAGFIGSFLVERLVDEGHEVTILDNEFRGDRENLAADGPNVTYLPGDIRTTDWFDSVGSVDRVFHLAAINGTKNFYEIPNQVIDVNIQGIRNVIGYAELFDIERVIFPSSSEVYGFPNSFPTSEDHQLQVMDPENPRYSYAGTKITGEIALINAARNADFDYTILRPHNIYGPRMGYDHVIPEFIERIVSEDVLTMYGDGEQTRSFCYISDAINGFIQAAFTEEGANEVFNLGDDRHETSINELAERLLDIADREMAVEHIDNRELEGSVQRRLPDISKIRSELGYEPTVSLNSGLHRTFEWYAAEFTGDSP